MDPACRDRWLAHAEQRIASAGMRSGATRTALIELLACDGQCLLSVEEIRRTLGARGVGSHASIYRILDELFALGLIHRLIAADGSARYEIVDPDPAQRHHHLIEDGSGAVEPFVDKELDRAIAAAAERLGVRLSGHEIVLRGTRGR